MTLLNDNDMAKGKKLSFVLQEIGREINTTGSKAYDAGIQKWVVMMKDELEKMKEGGKKHNGILVTIARLIVQVGN